MKERIMAAEEKEKPEVEAKLPKGVLDAVNICDARD